MSSSNSLPELSILQLMTTEFGKRRQLIVSPRYEDLENAESVASLVKGKTVYRTIHSWAVHIPTSLCTGRAGDVDLKQWAVTEELQIALHETWKLSIIRSTDTEQPVTPSDVLKSLNENVCQLVSIGQITMDDIVKWRTELPENSLGFAVDARGSIPLGPRYPDLGPSRPGSEPHEEGHSLRIILAFDEPKKCETFFEEEDLISFQQS